MKNTAKLAFDMLEKEMEVISSDETFEIMGGVGSTDMPPLSNCFYAALDHYFGTSGSLGSQNFYGGGSLAE